MKENETSTHVDDGDVATLSEDNYVNITCKDSTWVIDSVASFIFTYVHDCLITYFAGDYSSVRMGNEAVVNIMGIGQRICLPGN